MLPLAIVFASMALAQDVISVKTGESTCQEKLNAIQQEYDKRIAEIGEKRRKLGEQKTAQESRCAKQPDRHKCIAQAHNDYDRENNELNREADKADADRKAAQTRTYAECHKPSGSQKPTEAPSSGTSGGRKSGPAAPTAGPRGGGTSGGGTGGGRGGDEATDLSKLGCPECRCVNLSESPLLVDNQLQSEPIRTQGREPAYNCFFYVKTFIEKRKYSLELPERAIGQANLDREFLDSRGYVLVGVGLTLDELQAQPGDLVLVQGSTGGLLTEYVHAGIVTATAGGRIATVRQKADPRHCVFDATPAQFQRVYTPARGKFYQLWRNTDRAGVLPKVR